MSVSNLLTAFQIEIIERVSSFKESRRLKKAIDNLWLTHSKEYEKEISRSLEKIEENYYLRDTKFRGYKVVDKRVGEK